MFVIKSSISPGLRQHNRDKWSCNTSRLYRHHHSSPSLSRYLFSGVVSFSLLAGASCRSGRFAKSSCSASPIARDRTTIFPSLDTQTTRTSQEHAGMTTNRHGDTGHTSKRTLTGGDRRTQHAFSSHTKRERERGLSQQLTLQCIYTCVLRGELRIQYKL